MGKTNTDTDIKPLNSITANRARFVEMNLEQIAEE